MSSVTYFNLFIPTQSPPQNPSHITWIEKEFANMKVQVSCLTTSAVQLLYLMLICSSCLLKQTHSSLQLLMHLIHFRQTHFKLFYLFLCPLDIEFPNRKIAQINLFFPVECDLQCGVKSRPAYSSIVPLFGGERS